MLVETQLQPTQGNPQSAFRLAAGLPALGGPGHGTHSRQVDTI
jgi:hypothetical protein